MKLTLGSYTLTLVCPVRLTRAPRAVPIEEGSRRLSEVVQRVAESVPVDDAELARAKPLGGPYFPTRKGIEWR